MDAAHWQQVNLSCETKINSAPQPHASKLPGPDICIICENFGFSSFSILLVFIFLSAPCSWCVLRFI
jgi:hypothetical protein